MGKYRTREAYKLVQSITKKWQPRQMAIKDGKGNCSELYTNEVKRIKNYWTNEKEYRHHREKMMRMRCYWKKLNELLNI